MCCSKAWNVPVKCVTLEILPSREQSLPLGSCCLYSLHPWMNTWGAHLHSACSLGLSPAQSLPADLPPITGTWEKIKWCLSHEFWSSLLCSIIMIIADWYKYRHSFKYKSQIKRHKRNPPKCSLDMWLSSWPCGLLCIRLYFYKDDSWFFQATWRNRLGGNFCF